MLATARLKLMAALPAELRDRANLPRQRFHLDTSGWYLDPDRTPHLAAVVSATWNQNLIRVRYRRWAPRPEVARTLEPYGVVLKGGRWYLVAAAESQVRTYRVSQIVGLDILDQRFDRPAGFDLAEHWDDYLRDFDDRRYVASATIRLSPRALDLLPHVWEPTLVRAVRRSGRAEESGDWWRARIPMESVEHTAGLLLRLGADVEVVEPDGLRRHVAEVVITLCHPDRVARIFATNTVLPLGLPGYDDQFAANMADSSWFRWARAAHADGTFEQVLGNAGNTITHLMFALQTITRPENATPTWIRAYASPFGTPAECRGVIRFPRQLVAPDPADAPPAPDPDAVAAVRAKPAMLVEGMRDTALIPRYMIAAFREAYPDAPVIELPDAGHFTPEDAPETLLALLELFLKTTATTHRPDLATAGRRTPAH